MKTLGFRVVLVMIMSLGVAQARMMSPEDSVHRLQDGFTNSGVPKTVYKVESGFIGQVKSLAKQAEKEAKQIFSNWFGGNKDATKVAEKPAEPLRDENGLTKVERRQVDALKETLPEVQAKAERQESERLIQETEKQVRAYEPVVVSQPGRKGTSELRNTKAGVPVFDLIKKKKRKLKSGKTKVVRIKVKDIPRLDIGTPDAIAKSDFLPTELKNILKAPGQAQELPTPKALTNKELWKWTKKKIKLVKDWKPKEGEFGLGKVVTQTKVDNVDVAMNPEKVMEELKELHNITKKDLKMLMALILYEKGNKCHVAAGLLHDLATKSKYAEESNFYLGVCAHKMGLHSEAVSRLLKVVQTENPEFTSTAVQNLVEDLPNEYTGKVSKALKAMKNKELIPKEANDNMNYVHAQAAQAAKNWAGVVQHASKVSEQSKKYGDARYLYGIGLYAQGKKRQSEKALESLQKWMATTGKTDRNLQALTAVNLGRMKFKAERYEAAHLDYKKVPKDHPLWVDALIEQGWAQLNTGDSAGAIGNMYSLHSPYFQSVYMPESWVVRTIGYLNICQFGDAYRTLSKLEKMHTSHAYKIENYMKKNKSSKKYYSTVKNYLQGSSNKSVDGLPAQVIREVARNRGFLNVQSTINEKVDEISQYDFIYGILNKDIRKLKARKAAALQRRNAAKANLAKMKTNKKLKAKESEFRATVRAENSHMKKLAFEIYVHNSSKRGYRNMRTIAKKRLNSEKYKLRSVAGRKVKSQLKAMRTQIRQILEGNEFLRYEIFAGSGEDIRYQAAGGKTLAGNRIPANVKPQKILNWEFDGEYWEDEIGNYRSTLRNNCPDRARSVVGR